MKLYLECAMGAAGDMLMGALLELLPDKEPFLRRMRSLGLPGVEIGCEPSVKCGITGTKMCITISGEEETSKDAVPSGSASEEDSGTELEHSHEPEHEDSAEGEHEHTHGDLAHEHHYYDHEHSHVFTEPGRHAHADSHGHTHVHYTYNDICALIRNLDIAENVKDDALSVYKLIADAESDVHGVPVEQIHFHEVGSLDAVVDIVGCCLLIHMLGVSSIEASPVHVGSGFVRCAHGILPVPVPATAQILRDVPIYGGKIKGELCTPTGAALLKHFVRRFGEMEPMAVTKIGYGMGMKDFEAANCVRAFLSDRPETKDTVIELRCNLDDMTPEAVGFATELLLENGALDVFTTPITMKKNRSAVMFTCLCRPDDKNEMSRLILENTTTLGIRYEILRRDILDAAVYSVTTPYGDIRIKSAKGYGILKEKPEYDDVRAAAVAHGVPFFQVYAAASSAMKSHRG